MRSGFSSLEVIDCHLISMGWFCSLGGTQWCCDRGWARFSWCQLLFKSWRFSWILVIGTAPLFSNVVAVSEFNQHLQHLCVWSIRWIYLRFVSSEGMLVLKSFCCHVPWLNDVESTFPCFGWYPTSMVGKVYWGFMVGDTCPCCLIHIFMTPHVPIICQWRVGCCPLATQHRYGTWPIGSDDLPFFRMEMFQFAVRLPLEVS